MRKWVLAVGCLFGGFGIVAGFGVVAAAGGYTRGDIVGPPRLGGRIYQTTRNTDESVSRALEEARERIVASDDPEKDLDAMREEVALKTKELEERDRLVEVRDKTSFDLEVSKHRVNTGQVLSLSQHSASRTEPFVRRCMLRSSTSVPYFCSAGQKQHRLRASGGKHADALLHTSVWEPRALSTCHICNRMVRATNFSALTHQIGRKLCFVSRFCAHRQRLNSYFVAPGRSSPDFFLRIV